MRKSIHEQYLRLVKEFKLSLSLDIQRNDDFEDYFTYQEEDENTEEELEDIKQFFQKSKKKKKKKAIKKEEQLNDHD